MCVLFYLYRHNLAFSILLKDAPSRVSLFYIEEKKRQILTRYIAKGIDINKFILLFTDCTETYCYLSYFPSARLYDGPRKIDLSRTLYIQLRNEV